MSKELTGVEMIIKRYGGANINGVEWIWDHEKQQAVKVSVTQVKTKKGRKR